LLRSVSRATSAATSALDPAIIPGAAADALVRYLGARRVDVWRFDGRRPHHEACAGIGGDSPPPLPASLVRIARGGLAQVSAATSLDAGGAGGEWRRLLFSMDASSLSVHSLVVEDQVLGAITVVLEEDADEQLDEAITIFAQQIASALEKAQLHRASQDVALAMRMQNRVLAELTDERDVPSLRGAVEQLVSDVLGDVAISVLPVDSIGRLTVPLLTPPRDGMLRVASEPEMEFLAPALDASSTIRLSKPGLRMCAGLGLSALAGHEDFHREAGVWGTRLRTGERTTGVLLIGIAGDAPGAELLECDGRVHELFRALAPAVSIALENAQLFAREHVRASRLAAANSLARTVTGCSTRDELHEAIVVGIGALFGFTRAAVYGPDLMQLASNGRQPRGSDRERTLVSTSLHRRRASRVERHDRTCHAIPLVSGDRIHVVLYAEQPDTVTPEQEGDDLALLDSVCEHAAACLVAIEATESIERNYKDTIQALVHALEARDQYTADHSDLVAEWALEVGQRLGMNDSDLRDLELGAILHDIGKVAVPDQILHKPGRLTQEEFEVMKSHTVIGERILKPIGFLVNVAPIVRHEHERWDGRGYPDGVSGEQIPLASRIIFVCDAYHAITSDRPYRKAQPHAFARKIVTENAGTQFDPAVVSVFLDVIDAWCIEQGSDAEVDVAGIAINNPLGKSIDTSMTGRRDESAPAA